VSHAPAAVVGEPENISGVTHMQKECNRVLCISVEGDGESATVKCRGRLVAGTTNEFSLAVKQLLPQTKVVFIHLAELTYIDSAGLSTVLRLRASARKAGCQCELPHLGKQLRNLLRLRNVLNALGQVEEHGITIA
jgi:anti-sigma B factor antagonist